MKSISFRNGILTLALLALPLAVRAAAPHFTGPPASFAGIYSNNRGALTVTLSANGKFTGKGSEYPGKTISLHGTLGASGTFSGVFGNPAVPYGITLTGTSLGTYILTGSTGGREIVAYPNLYSKTNPTVAAKYTTLITGTDPSLAVPQGTGYATINISKTGAGSVSGKLADGTSFTASGVLVNGTSGPELVVFDQNIYGHKGLIAGSLNVSRLLSAVVFQNQVAVQTGLVPSPDAAYGNLLWDKQAKKGSYYAAGFSTTVYDNGYLYSKGLGVPFTTGTATIGGGGLSSAVEQPFTVTSAGVVTISGTNPNNVKLSFKTSTGAISGSFEPVPGKKPKVNFRGLLVQYPDDAIGGGYFLGPVVSGTGLSGYIELPTLVK